jgi:hypothetical protein
LASGGALWFLLGFLARADLEFAPSATIHFSSKKEGAAILGRSDDFIKRLSEFDRASRMKTAGPVSTARFLQFVQANVTDWTEPERSRLEAAIAGIRPALDRLSLPWPRQVSLIKTTGAEEGQAFYTRDTAIVFPEATLRATSDKELQRTVAHELFHILSRNNPSLREALYRAIGFEKCAEAELPQELRKRKITNPDAPKNDHSIQLEIQGKKLAAIPILFARIDHYDPAQGGEFFQYLDCQLLVPAREASNRVVPLKEGGGFFEQVGRNTNYVIHPEEILADNFALLVIGEAKVPSPEVLQRIETVLRHR